MSSTLGEMFSYMANSGEGGEKAGVRTRGKVCRPSLQPLPDLVPLA